MNDLIDITWENLVKFEPRLGDLLSEIEKLNDDKTEPSFCANKIWYSKYKKEMVKLVGEYAEVENPILQSSEAYDLVMKILYDSLPPCRNCGCL